MSNRFFFLRKYLLLLGCYVWVINREWYVALLRVNNVRLFTGVYTRWLLSKPRFRSRLIINDRGYAIPPRRLKLRVKP